MAEKLGRALLELDTDDGKFDAGVDRAHKKTEILSKEFDRAGKVGVAAFTAVAAGATLLIDNATAAIARYKDLADIAGTAADKISGMEAPARLAGISLDSVAQSVARLGRSIGEARLGDPGKASLLKALGIDPNDGRDAAEVYVDVARAIVSMTDKTIAGKVANDLLGRSYAELTTFMKELTEQGGLQARITNEQAEAADKFRDDLARLSLKVQDLKHGLAIDLMPALQFAADEMLRAAKEGEGLHGVMVAIISALTGSEMHQNNKRLVELTSEQFALENRLMELRSKSSRLAVTDLTIEKLEAQLKRVNAELTGVLEQRKLLEGGGITAVPKAAPDNFELMGDVSRLKAKTPQDLVKDRMEFERHYQERVAAAQGFYERYAQAVKLGETLTREAEAQGRLGALEVIEQERAAEDARLQVLIHSLTEQRRLHQEMGDLAAARVAQEKIAAAEAARVANDAIAQARTSSREQQLQDELAAINNEYNAKVMAMAVNIAQQNMTEKELLDQQLKEKQDAIDAAALIDFENAAYWRQQRELAELQHQAKLGSAHAQGVLERRRIEQMNLQQQVAYYSGTLATVTAEAARHNKTMFNSNKAASIANATMSMYEGANKAWAQGGIFGAVLAAIVIAAGLINIKAIASQRFGGGTSAPSIGGGTATPVFNAPIIPAAPAAAQQPVAAEKRATVNMTFTGSRIALTAEEMRDVIKDFGAQLGYGLDVNVTTTPG